MFGECCYDSWLTFDVNDSFGVMAYGTNTFFASVIMAVQMCWAFDDVGDTSFDFVGRTVEKFVDKQNI